MIEVYSFSSLFHKDIPLGDGRGKRASRVEIPRIQRPYAQGRKDDDSQRVRKNFLDVLFAFLLGNESLFDLDFIYGKMELELGTDDDWTLQVLDGQQRLTTLFLMHVYFLIREGSSLGTPKREELVQALGSFSYETRDTSADFCSILVRDLDQLSFEKIKPSLEIRSLLDYVNAFDEDPTVDAMLTMLDAIHERYCRDVPKDRKGSLLPRLDFIRFRVLSLTDYKLSEELYIKMNARGLPLTPFEMFKPDFLGLMDAISGEVRLSTGERASDRDEDKVAFKVFFATKLDTIWCEPFWDGSNPKTYEISYLKFFSRYFAAKFVLEKRNGVHGKEWESNETLQKLLVTYEKDVVHYHGIEPFKELATPSCFKEIGVLLGLLSSKQSKDVISQALKPLWESKDEPDWFCNGDIPYTQSTLAKFAATIEFIRLFPPSPTFLGDLFEVWMKCVNNIIENTDINKRQAMASVVSDLALLLQTICTTIEQPVSPAKFIAAMAAVPKDKCANAQTKDEIEKARRIADAANDVEKKRWTDAFDEVSRHLFLKGMMGFFYSPDMTIDEFENHVILIGGLFDKTGIAQPYRDEHHWMLRAILAQLTRAEHLGTQYILEDAETNKYLKNTLSSLNHSDLRARINQLFAKKLLGCTPGSGAKASPLVLQKFEDAFKTPPPVDANQSWDVAETIRVIRDEQIFLKWVFDKGRVKVYNNYNNRQYQARLGSSQTCLMLPLLRFMETVASEEGMTRVPVTDGYNGFDTQYDLFVGQDCSMEKPLSSFPKAFVRISFYSAQHADYAVELSVFMPTEEENRLGKLIAGTSKPVDNGFRHLILDKKFSPSVSGDKLISLAELKAEVEKLVNTPPLVSVTASSETAP